MKRQLFPLLLNCGRKHWKQKLCGWILVHCPTTVCYTSYLLSLTYLTRLTLFLSSRSTGHLQCNDFPFLWGLDVPVIIVINSARVWPTHLQQVCEWTHPGLHGNCNSLSSKHPAIHHPVWLRCLFLSRMERTRVVLLGELLLSLPDC